MAARGTQLHPFEPDYAVPPGATLRETIEALGMNQKELAVRTNLAEKTVCHILQGKAPVTYDTAIALERVTGVPASMWNNLEKLYREQLAKLSDRQRLAADMEWLRTIPTNELIKRQAIAPERDRRALLDAVLKFFGVSSAQAWKDLWLSPAVAARKSRCFTGQPGATATWLRLGELAAQQVECRTFSRNRFRAALAVVRNSTVRPPEQFIPEMQSLCAKAGVAVVLIPEIKKAPWSGASWWLSPTKAVIELSLRYKTDDQLWFSFFHEAGHIINVRKKEVFINDESEEAPREKKANRFAAEILIPRRYTPQLEDLRSRAAIEDFAALTGIAPGIVVGRLQKEGILPYSHLNALKRRFRWIPQ